MASQADVDAVHALVVATDHAGAAVKYGEDHPALYLASLADVLAKVERVERVTLSATDGAGGMMAWKNPTGQPILVKVVIDLTTKASAAHTADIGTATDATTSSDDLMDLVDLGAAAGVFSSHDDPGTNGKSYRRLEIDKFVTASTATGAAAGLAGTAQIFHKII